MKHRGRHLTDRSQEWRLARRTGHGRDLAHPTDLEPAHDQPWVPRSAFTDRLRRSPRR